MGSSEPLVARAREAAEDAYAVYSRFRVGAAILCDDGTIYTGFNIENRSYGLTVCAERSALFRALTSGHKEFAEIAIAGLDHRKPLPPCGACRQVLSEFFSPAAPVHFSGSDGEIITVRLDELLPFDSLHES